MAKTIWIVGHRSDVEPTLDKYIVVYENGESYFCKVSGSSNLKQFSKSDLGKDPNSFVSNGKENLDEIKVALKNAKQIHRLSDLKRRVSWCESDIVDLERQIDRRRRELRDATISLRELEQEIESVAN